MRELLLSGAIVLAALLCVLIGKALVRWRSEPFEPPLTRLSYDLEKYSEVPMLDNFAEKWAAFEAAHRDEKGEVQ